MKKKSLIAGFFALVFVVGLLVAGGGPALAKQLEIAVLVPNGVDPYFTAKRYGYETEVVMQTLTDKSGN